jgi:predicted metal-dependent hydrolase
VTELRGEVLRVGGLDFLVRRSERRKTIGITIERDGSLVVVLPAGCEVAEAESAIHRKLTWVHTKLATKDDLRVSPRPKEYVTGEGHYYIGRSYRLQLTDPTETEKLHPPLRLDHGRFVLRRDERERAAEHFERWYIEHGLPHIQRKVILFSERFGAAPTSVVVRDLGFRWGQCSANGELAFHWRTVLLPLPIVEYVVVHELAHLFVGHHSMEYWALVERVMPDFERRRQRLAVDGGQTV